jgi:uncharacterized protein (DUF58 family)
MREALRGLTLRGRSFLSAGAACALAVVLVGQLDVLRLGVFLVGLPVIAAAWVTRSRYRLAHSREVVPVRVPVGHVAEVRLHVKNVSRLPTSVLLVEDRLSYTLGGRPRFILDRLEPGSTREVSYPIRSDVRGRYKLGPLSVRITDPFGLCELTRSFSTVDELVVTPVVHPLPDIGLGGEWTGGGDAHSRAVASAGEDDASTREYRYGDDLRKVHWKSTARTGELMVRREEQPWQSRATLVLDCRGSAHQGEGPGSSFEWAVSAAASIGVHLAQAGYTLRFLTDDGTDLSTTTAASTQSLLLETLALVQPSRNPTLRGVTTQLSSTGEGLIVAVLGTLRPDEVAALTRLPQTASGAVAVAIDTTSWTNVEQRVRAEATRTLQANVALLRRSGWRVLTPAHGASLPALWPHAARRSGAAVRAAGAMAGAGRGSAVSGGGHGSTTTAIHRAAERSPNGSHNGSANGRPS